MHLLRFLSAYARSSHSSQGHYSHGKTLFSADDSTSNLTEKTKFIQSDCPGLPQAYLHVWTSTIEQNSFALSGCLFSILVSRPQLWDGTQLVTFFLTVFLRTYMSCPFLVFLPIWLPFQVYLSPPISKCRYSPRIFPWFFIPWRSPHFSC